MITADIVIDEFDEKTQFEAKDYLVWNYNR